MIARVKNGPKKLLLPKVSLLSTKNCCEFFCFSLGFSGFSLGCLPENNPKGSHQAFSGFGNTDLIFASPPTEAPGFISLGVNDKVLFGFFFFNVLLVGPPTNLPPRVVGLPPPAAFAI